MQQPYQFKPTWYFVFGSSQKSSLCSQFCRQNDFIYLCNPEIEQLKGQVSKHAMIQGSVQLFYQLQKIKPQLSVILIGNPTNVQQKTICEQYKQIGRFKHSSTFKYEQFRKKVYPNLIFVYGPLKQQTNQVAKAISENIGYTLSFLKPDANDYISHIDKCSNYVINDTFMDPKQLRVLVQFFQVRVIHLKYNRVDLPNQNEYFDKQFTLVSYLKDKSYYIQANAKQTPMQVISEIQSKLCPTLIYVNALKQEHFTKVYQFVQEKNGLHLNIQKIQSINKRKGLPIFDNPMQKILLMTSIIYKDLNRNLIVITRFPWNLDQVLLFQKLSRKISQFIDYTESSQYQFNKKYSTPIYFLQNQKWKKAVQSRSLKEQLEARTNYWLIGGASGVGKSSVAKFIANQFGYKLIQFQPYLSLIKDKLITPQQGEQVPVKKVIAHFKQLFTNDYDPIYVIDCLPYANKDLQDWINTIGPPNVINLQAQTNEQIKRLRKKAQADLAAQINEEESNKAKDSTEKNKQWVQKIQLLCPSASIYKVDYNGPQIIVQNQIKRILSPRIYLAQKNSTNIYQNIALKYDLGFVSLLKIRLRDCAKNVKNCKKRDIILCHHGHQKNRIVSQDLYWIQKNLGQVRYIGVWQPQNKEDVQQFMKLQRPQVVEKVKVQGQGGQQKPAEQPPAQGDAAKKKEDIYDFQWSKPGEYKNLSQWFHKTKRNISSYTSSPQECFKKFGSVLDEINKSSEVNIYETVK